VRVNRQIRAREVRVIGEGGEQLGVLPLYKALEVALEHDLDLVEVASTAIPPVCRLLDYGKYKYEQTKKDKKARKGQRGLLREVRFRPKIEEHDLQAKIKKVRELLQDGSKVMVLVRFRGREIIYPELGWKVLRRVAEALKGEAVASDHPVRNQRNIALTLSPISTRKTEEARTDAKA